MICLFPPPQPSLGRILGLNAGGDEGPDDCVIVSEISGTKSGVEGDHDILADRKLEVLETWRSACVSLAKDDILGILDGVKLRRVDLGEWEGLSIEETESDWFINRLFISSMASSEGLPDKGLSFPSGVPNR